MGKTVEKQGIWPFVWAMLAFAMLFGPAPLGAHEGHHGPDVLTRILSTERVNTRLAITIELTGLGGPIVLTGISAPGATIPRIQPVYINFAQDVLLSTHLTFSTAIPARFTLTLEFGPLGVTQIEVSP
ncbi:MAG: hypothetical protein AAFY75_09290 [Pseudomonadota bacterium]